VTEAWIDYEWAVIRLVPKVHTEQFVNVGILLHARQAGFLEASLSPDCERRARAFSPELDIERARQHLDTYARICAGDASAGEVALLPASERFHWLTHPRSGILQTSPRHPGRCLDLNEELRRLLAEQCT
jgi:hypothetical protein